MVTLGSARWGETGGYNQNPGDASGGEVATEPYYTHQYGWNIIRAKSAKQANKLAERMLAACKNNNIGYDMNGRYGIIKYGIDTKTKTEADCSSLVRQCVIEACGKDPGDFTTLNEKTKLLATGLFNDAGVCDSKAQAESKLYTGDILVSKKQGHTVIVTSAKSRAVANTWQKDSKGWKYYDAKGNIVKSKWVKWKDEWYYLKANGYMAATQWQKDSKGWCYLDETGKAVKSKWVKWKGYWYYLKPDCHMAVSQWVTDKKGTCWVDKKGKWLKATKWLKVDGIWYHLTNGYMDKNAFAKDSHGWCWLGPDGKWAKSQWVTYKGEKYYIKANGYMATGTIIIDGKTYKFDKYGNLLSEG